MKHVLVLMHHSYRCLLHDYCSSNNSPVKWVPFEYMKTIKKYFSCFILLFVVLDNNFDSIDYNI